MSEPRKSLDKLGRCCGRKPLVYKRYPSHKFCCRCNASFDPETGRQIANWAFDLLSDEVVQRRSLKREATAGGP